MVVAAVDFPALSSVRSDKPVHMSVETALARLLFPPHNGHQQNPPRRCTLSEPSPFPTVSAVRGAASSALGTCRVADSLCLSGSGRPSLGLFPLFLLEPLTFLSPRCLGLCSLRLPRGSWRHSSVPWSPKESLSSRGPVCVHAVCGV